ncbi:soluble NSF attachment family protein [Flavobacterium sp. LS1R49]|uniref:Soluble NSF attachment family protein n=1 Tax=Flavobacterium shii TaxID=2987687 RepID=A0A9X3C3W8_9FLAO|nr:soluble NSF attachment family protein [Flavobacterium shii]MCV9926159.1 soluble NSF attachment family protein [Flavobacterium shii]
MELKLKINTKNTFPKGGIFIKSASAEVWLHEIQNIGLSLDSIAVFPVPDIRANELYGCLLVLNQRTDKVDIRGNNFLQLIANKLFIPENTLITPELTEDEWSNLFSESYHFLHPEIGLVELKEEVNWTDLLQLPMQKEIEITEALKTVSIPQFITSMRIEIDQEKILETIENPPSEEEIIGKMPFDMQKVMKGNQKEMDKFMAFLDKNPKMALQYAIPLDTLGTSRGDNYGKFSFGSENVFRSFFSKIGDLFGGQSGGLTLIFRLIFVLFFVSSIRSCSSGKSNFIAHDFFVFVVILILAVLIISFLSGGESSGSGSASGGSFLVDSQRFSTLQSKYEKLAEEFIEKREYQKAAHIYLKLLKNYPKAAEILEKGELYSEAAAIYLKYCKNKQKAAACYEKGHAYKEAIEIYKELNNDEKVGDLYLILKDKKEADKYFNRVIENYKMNFQYVKASLVYKNKIGDVTEAQEILLQGWKTNKDAGKCLNNYFTNIDSAEDLSIAINDVYKNTVIPENAPVFLHLLKHEFTKHEENQGMIKNIAYEIVADRIDKNPDVASELVHFNKNNKLMLKDVMKYKLKAKKKTR